MIVYDLVVAAGHQVAPAVALQFVCSAVLSARAICIWQQYRLLFVAPTPSLPDCAAVDGAVDGGAAAAAAVPMQSTTPCMSPW